VSTRELLEELNPDAMLIPGKDAALIGVVERCGQPAFAVYDRGLLVALYVREGMTEEEAEEWITVDIDGAWVGDGTPAVLVRVDPIVNICG
jgi:hypothetical protein